MMIRILPMKDNGFLKKILFNWPEKVLCFVVAVLIYFLYQGHSLDRKNISVPLDVIDNGQVTLGKEVPRFVRISLRGKATDLARINENDVTALIDISSYVETGIYEVPINLSFSSKIIAIDPLEIKVDPDYLQLNMESKAVGYLTPVVRYNGNVPTGYKIDNVEFEPDRIKVIGPSSIVEKIKNINTVPVDVSNVSKDIAEVVAVEKINKLISFPDGDKVKVKISIAPVMIEKEFSEYEIACRNLFAGYVGKTDKVLIDAKISGPELKVNSFNRLKDFAYVDCSLIDDVGDYELELKFDLPSDVVLKNYSPQKIIVTINDFSTLYSDINSEATSVENIFADDSLTENAPINSSGVEEKIMDAENSSEALLDKTEIDTGNKAENKVESKAENKAESQESLSEENKNTLDKTSEDDVKTNDKVEDASEKIESNESKESNVEGLL